MKIIPMRFSWTINKRLRTPTESMHTVSASQVKAILRKDVLVRKRQPWMTLLQLLWPCMAFVLLYLIRLKFGPEHMEDCQFPTRMLPTKNNVLPAFYSYICSIENKCMSTKEYEEYTNWEKAPMKPIVDIVQIFINDDRMFQSVIELPEKANFISAVTTLVTGGHIDEIRRNVEKVIDLVPTIEESLNGSFDIKKLFSDRHTFVKGGYLLCGHPFPSTESIPLVNDILYSEDFSEINDDELKVMPTNYCKKLYLDVTSSNHGKLTWSTIKPIIHGKILYAPNNSDTQSIMQFSNSTFQELDRLKMLSIAIHQILTKLREDDSFQRGFDSLINLAQTPFVKSLIGDEIDIDQIAAVIKRIRTDPIIYDVITTVKNILECFSVDRFVPLNTEEELRKKAYELNNQRLFYSAVYFNNTNDANIEYKFHMDTDNTQPTFENKNRFWFPGPSASMLRDLKYHRGFVQTKQALDLGIIKHLKTKLLDLGVITEKPTTTTQSSLSVQVLDNDVEDDSDDDWFTSSEITEAIVESTSKPTILKNFFSGLNENNDDDQFKIELDENLPETTTALPEALPNSSAVVITTTENSSQNKPVEFGDDDKPIVNTRIRRQGFLDLFLNYASADNDSDRFEVDKMQFYTRQFPYPAYIHDDFKTGLYLAQAIQVAFFLGLVVEIASCVRHRIWMHESRNTMLMRSMGLKPCSDLIAWILITFAELIVIFLLVTIILYIGGILEYTKWIFVFIFLLIFGACLISFCYMCSTFFNSATIGAVATVILFFITYCPYIIVLLFDAQLSAIQDFLINLSFTTAFSHGWSHIMRMELQQAGLSFYQVFEEGLKGEFGFAFLMIVVDTVLYAIIAEIVLYFKNDEYRFINVERDYLDANMGATMTNVSKIYNDNNVAVSNVSFSFLRDRVTCLLGRNGAGKSTIIKMLTGQEVPSSGNIILSQTLASKETDKIGVCSQDNILIPNLTAREHLELYAKIKVKRGFQGEVEKTLRSLSFGKYESYQASQLSGGFQRRLCVAIAFIGSPNVVILDEPCNGVDTKARRHIWELIERLRHGRAVIMATHFMDEAEQISDDIVFMNEGLIAAKHNPESLMLTCTKNFSIFMRCNDAKTSLEIISFAKELLFDCEEIQTKQKDVLQLQVPYNEQINNNVKFLNYLLDLQSEGRIQNFYIETHNLEKDFKQMNNSQESTSNGWQANSTTTSELKENKFARIISDDRILPTRTAISQLFWKRFTHFRRNYRMLLCVLVLPALFELLAMWFVAYRLEDDFDKTISLSRNLYTGTTQMLSLETPTPFTQILYDDLKADCTYSAENWNCKEFTNSSAAFYWILNTLHDYHDKRYGGYSFNRSSATVWYNNKGYHAMMGWLNDLNSHIMQNELNDTEYSITAYNEPWKLGATELSTSSVLRQAGDACMAFILLIAFCLVVAVASVYLVNERTKGEKLQQKLCGVSRTTYWAVAFVWDFLIFLLALAICTSIVYAFHMPVFVDRHQLIGLVVLSVFFGFACIPAVHVFEKLFVDSSVAIVSIFCMNLIIPLFTMAIIVLLGVIGDSAVWDEWRYFLNRAFLIFPQHALGDGLLEICKNYMIALVFHRYDIDSYKHPITSDLLRPHFISLFVLGVFFLTLNILLESGVFSRIRRFLCRRIHNDMQFMPELNIVSIQNSLQQSKKMEKKTMLSVNNLSKAYEKNQFAVKNVSFDVKAAECFGLLGKNGAGKSTIFKLLSGELKPDFGTIKYTDKRIAYCPQTNTLDSLLTVAECIKFYGRLRQISDIPHFVGTVLDVFQLRPYRNVLVKNLSGGNRRKLVVATTCCGNTSTVLMDEPTSDMDPVTRRIIYNTILGLLAENRAIVLTSHSISEIDELCQRIAVLKDGQLITCSSVEQLKSQYGNFYKVTVFCEQSNLSVMEKILRQYIPQCVHLQTFAHSVRFSVKSSNKRSYNNDRHSTQDNEEVQPYDGKTLAELFEDLGQLSKHFEGKMRFSIDRCRLDAVFENILDSNNLDINTHSNIASIKLNGTPSTGFVHNGYVETETIT